MNECTRFDAMLEAEIAGTIDPATAEVLRRHARECESCRGLLALHDDLLRLGTGAAEPTPAAFEAVTSRLAARAPRRMASPAPAWRVAGGLAAGVLLFAAGLASGWALGDSRVPDGDPGGTGGLVAAMSAEAAANRRFADVEDSRFTYSNVAVRSAGEGRIALDFDVTTHVRLVEPIGSELSREVLVHALLDRSSTGARLRALTYAGAPQGPKVRDALILSLRSDPSLAVRLKALELLAAEFDQPGVEEAVLATLREDEAVQMRLLALETLAARQVDRERIRDVIRASEQAGDEALLVRLASLAERL